MTQDKINELRDLTYEIYNAEDVMSGCYSTEKYKYDEDVRIVNENYKKLLSDMNGLIKDIEKVIGK